MRNSSFMKGFLQKIAQEGEPELGELLLRFPEVQEMISEFIISELLEGLEVGDPGFRLTRLAED